MPSGAKKRKAAKKKKSSADSASTANPLQGESDNGELSSPTSQENVIKIENNSSENKSKDNIKIEKGSKSKSSSSSGSSDDESNVVEKNIVVVESGPNESVPVVESFSEKISVKPVDSLLEEVSQVFDEMENEKKKDLAVSETSSVVVEPVLKENEEEKLVSVDEKGSSVSKNNVSPSMSPEMAPENVISGDNGADSVNETDINGDSNRQAQAASPAISVQKTTTWKSCCGIFELFSGSER